MSRAPGLALVVALALSSSARGAELLRSEDGTRVWEASAFVKPYASWLAIPSELVDATAELDRTFDDTRALLPPDLAAELPDNVALPEQVGLSTWTGRVQSRLILLGDFELELAYQAAAVFSTSPALGAGATSTGLLGTELFEAQRRLVDFEPYLVDDETLKLQHNLDRLLVRWQTAAFALTVGRQAISWGTGRLWNPTDLMSPFSPTDVDREVRRGADAARLSLPLGATSQMELLWLPRQELEEQGFVVRVQANAWQTDVSGSAAKYIDDLVLGADLAGDLGPLGVHAEAAWTVPLDEPVDGDFVRAVGGVDWRPVEEVVLGAEYYFNGLGAEDADHIVTVLRNPRVVRGEVYGAGRHYVGLLASWLVDELLTVSGTAVVNVLDPGALLVPALEYSLAQDVLLRAGAFVPLAAGVDVELFRALGPMDVLTRSEAFEHATTTLGARSEHGLSPMGGFVQLGAYFQ